jgi:hypothetical protein
MQFIFLTFRGRYNRYAHPVENAVLKKNKKEEPALFLSLKLAPSTASLLANLG